MADIIEERAAAAKKRLGTVVDQVLAYMLKDIEVFAPADIETYKKIEWVEDEMERVTNLVTDKIEKKDEDHND